MAITDSLIVRYLDCREYEDVFEAMKDFTRNRQVKTSDEIWLLEHQPVLTLGLAADSRHILSGTTLPVIQTDRGGEVTYHGPGQAVIYLLMDLKRRSKNGLFIKEFVRELEQAIIETLSCYHLDVERQDGAPGIYLSRNGQYGEWQGAKIAALGLKVQGNGCIYHGFSINVDMDLRPFSGINPCGFPGLKSIDMKTMGVRTSVLEVQDKVVQVLCSRLGMHPVFQDDNPVSNSLHE